jgi:hypothetical protein
MLAKSLKLARPISTLTDRAPRHRSHLHALAPGTSAFNALLHRRDCLVGRRETAELADQHTICSPVYFPNSGPEAFHPIHDIKASRLLTQKLTQRLSLIVAATNRRASRVRLRSEYLALGVR